MAPFKHLSPDGLVSLMAEGSVQIVDIRDERSFEIGRIRGALHLDNTGVQRFVETADLDAPLVVCCYHGNSSQPAAAFMNEKGFDDVYSLDGGFSQWQLEQPTLVESS